MSGRRIAPLTLVVLFAALLLAVGRLGNSPTPVSASALEIAAPLEQLELPAIQDSWLNEAAPADNYGGQNPLYVGRSFWNDTLGQQETVVKFDLSALPTGAQVLSATLILDQVGWDGARSYTITPHAAFDAWEEMNVTWNTRPDAFNLGDPARTLDTSDGPRAWDVTNIVANWQVGEIANYGIVLRGDGDTEGLRLFASRETTGSTPPRLVIDYTIEQPGCTLLTSPDNIPAPGIIDFDDLANGAVIADHYVASHGVKFENNKDNRAIIYGNEPGEAQSPPNVASNSAVFPATSENVPLPIYFSEPKTHAGFWIGNGETEQLTAVVRAFDVAGTLICEGKAEPVPEPHTEMFVGLHDPAGRIAMISLDYGNTRLSESIDDLYFAPYDRPASPTPTATRPATRTATATATRPATRTPTATREPTRTPRPTWTPRPTNVPTQGPTRTPTPMLQALPYNPPVATFVTLPPGAFTPDLSIHGIEITQGIQCFDTSKGLGGCADNSLPVIAKKDTTARIYLRYNGIFSQHTNVPVRLHIFANGVEYIANATGTARPTIQQGANYDARIYFNVNFSSDVSVSFYAEVDPNNQIGETNENNNRFPATGTFALPFRARDTLEIVGQRTRYHPSGYSGTQYAQGWAVNGGAATWFEQMLPVRNGGIDYRVASGYLDWTQTMNSDGQHALIQTLNGQWVLANLFSLLFTGQTTGVDHLYGWVDNEGYSGGHADMPVYPHAGGLGVVGIGTDGVGHSNAGSGSSNNPGAGALIFGHELVHDYDVYHTNTGADDCGSNDGNSNFPYATSSIQEFGFNPVTSKIYDPATTHDLMSYCPAGGSKEGWIAPFTWNRMFNEFATSLYRAATSEVREDYVFYRTGDSESVMVNLTVFNPDLTEGGGTLGDMYRVQTGASVSLPDGDYEVQLRNGEEVLARESFTVNFESEYSESGGTGHHHGENSEGHSHGEGDEPPFPATPNSSVGIQFIMPWVEGANQVVLLHDSTVLDQRALSANAPTVQITTPSEEVEWEAETLQTIVWEGNDADGDTLHYSLFYSYDLGESWSVLASGLTTSSYEVNVDALAGGNDVRFRVVATDGINSAFAETEAAISIPNKAPVATILSPSQDWVVTPGGVLVLTGTGTDLEDGALRDAALHWESDRAGSLGIGPSVALNSLEPGAHTITLTVTDSLGDSHSVSVQIWVGHRISLPVISTP